MTLGEKLREARRQFGWSQEELAGKLYVTRAAIAKWETDGGIPDMPNLKVLAALLQVSIDWLLDDGAEAVGFAVREAIVLADYGKGMKKQKSDRAIKAKYPDADIHLLMPKIKPSKAEKILDNVFGWLTPIGFGVPDMVNALKIPGYYYLVSVNDRKILAVVTDTYIESRALFGIDTSKKFEYNNCVFTDCGSISPKR